MPDYLGDLCEVIRRSEGSELRKQKLIRQARKLDLKVRRSGGDVNKFGQRYFCQALSPEDHKVQREWMFKLCVSRLVRGDFSDWTGWEYRNEWALGSYSPEVPNKRWRLEPVRSIAVLGEQGIGDEIMFGSCLPDLMSRVPKVVFECDPRLVDIFARSLPGLECKPRADVRMRGDPLVKYLTAVREEDAFIPVGDLPRLFRKSRGDFPRESFLRPLPEYVHKWSKYRGRVGVAWRSRTGQLGPRDLVVAGSFGEPPVALQYDAWPYELEGLEVPDCDLKDGVEDILGIVANLSKVVTVPQTIVHFAGAVGTPVDVVFPTVGSSRVVDQFRYRYIDPMPWYPSVRVYENLDIYRRHRRSRAEP